MELPLSSEGFVSCGADFFDLIQRVFCLPLESPDGAGPGGIGLGAADDVDVHLADDVSDAGDVEFVGFEMVVDEVRGGTDDKCDLGVSLGGELVEVFNAFLNFRNDEQPGEGGVVFESKMAAADERERMGAFFEAWVELETHRLRGRISGRLAE
jgi:hypothetical protein